MNMLLVFMVKAQKNYNYEEAQKLGNYMYWLVIPGLYLLFCHPSRIASVPDISFK